MQESLKLCCLLLPPANRRKLHLLLKLMSKIEQNEELQLSGTRSPRNLVGTCICTHRGSSDMLCRSH